jgi:integrase
MVRPEQRTYVVGKAKGKEARVLPVPDWLWSAIHGMPKPMLSEWVFPSNTGKPWRSHFCLRVIDRACKKLELGKVTQHRLRATFASWHAAAGTPIVEIQGMLGHKNIATTMIYVETSLEAKRAAQDALSQKLGLA